MTAVCVVQGASRGLGLQFCNNLLQRSCKVIATCRNPSLSEGLKDLKKENEGSLFVYPLDAMKEDDIKTVAQQVKDSYGKVDLLINCAGMLHPSGRGETSLKGVSQEGLMATLSTNSVGPTLMAKHFAPLLLKGDGFIGNQNSDVKQNKHVGILVNMSAKVGSIQDNGLGGWYSYRMSKAALNMATKNLSIELGRGHKKVVCISLHPGTVDTDLSRPYHKGVKNLFTIPQSVDYMMNVVDSLSIEDTGKFYNYEKVIIPF